jgi:hypothetical protein
LTAVKARTATVDMNNNKAIPLGRTDIIIVLVEKEKFCFCLSICHSIDVVTFMSNLVSKISTDAVINHGLLSVIFFSLVFVYQLLTGCCLVYLTHLLVLPFFLSMCMLLFQAMTPSRDTCFSDLLLTAESVDNGGLRLRTVVSILSLDLYRWKSERKIIDRQERRYPSPNY